MASWKDGLEGLRERNVTELACVMMSSQKPPYSAEVLEEARKSARKVEGGFASRSKHAKEYAAKVAAKNIALQIRGEEPTKRKEFGDIPAVCVMDAGNNGVIILADKMLPPRKAAVMIPGPQSHWAKVAFEKYFLWKMKEGHVHLP